MRNTRQLFDKKLRVISILIISVIAAFVAFLIIVLLNHIVPQLQEQKFVDYLLKTIAIVVVYTLGAKVLSRFPLYPGGTEEERMEDSKFIKKWYLVLCLIVLFLLMAYAEYFPITPLGSSENSLNIINSVLFLILIFDKIREK